MAVLIIGTGKSAVDLPTPTDMTVSLQDIDSRTTTRNAKGYMMRDRVRGAASVVRKVECAWKGKTMREVSEIMQAVAPQFLQLTYPDTYTGEIRTGEFYVGDRKCTFLKVDSDGENGLFSDIKIDFIER